MEGRHGNESTNNKCTVMNGAKAMGDNVSPLGSTSGVSNHNDDESYPHHHISSTRNNGDIADERKDEKNVDQITRWILNAIEVIRHERQRPSLDRIVRKMKYHHNTDAGVVEDRVRTAVECGRMVKIFSNQGIAYNDPVRMRKVSKSSISAPNQKHQKIYGQGRKRASLSLAKSSSSQSKRARQNNKSGSYTKSSSRNSPSPRNQAETRQDGLLVPLYDVSVVLERLPSIERLIVSNATVQVAPGNADSPTQKLARLSDGIGNKDQPPIQRLAPSATQPEQKEKRLLPIKWCSARVTISSDEKKMADEKRKQTEQVDRTASDSTSSQSMASKKAVDDSQFATYSLELIDENDSEDDSEDESAALGSTADQSARLQPSILSGDKSAPVEQSANAASAGCRGSRKLVVGDEEDRRPLNARLWTNIADEQRRDIENRDPVEEQATSSNTAAVEERIEDEEEDPRFDEEPEQPVEEPMEEIVVESRSNEVATQHDPLLARLEADHEQLRTKHEAELTQRSNEYQRELDELNRAREEAEKRLKAAAVEYQRVNAEHDVLIEQLRDRSRGLIEADVTQSSHEYQRDLDELNRAREEAEKHCHHREAELQAAALEHQRVNAGRNELIEQLRVANDNRVKISEEWGQLKEIHRRLEEMNAEKESKIRSLSREVMALHGQLEEKRTLQAEWDDALSRKNETEKTIRDLKTSNIALTQELDEQRSQLEQLKDALREAERDKERSDIDYRALETEAMERVAQQKEVDRQRVDAELEQLREQLRVATDDGVKVSEECRYLKDENRRLEDEARCKSQINVENETKIRSLTTDVETSKKRTLQAELERDKRDVEHKKTVHDLIASHDRALQQQKDDLHRQREVLESQLTDMRLALIELEEAKVDAMKRSDSFREVVVVDNRPGRREDSIRFVKVKRTPRDAFLASWSDDEKRIFKEKFVECDKDFVALKKFLDNKTVKECVEYYYLTKMTENYNKMLRKKKYRPGQDGDREIYLKPWRANVATLPKFVGNL